MKTTKIKALGLAALLFAGATAQAQSVSITQNGGGAVSSPYCLNADAPGVTFKVVPHNLMDNGTTPGKIESTTWTLIGGIMATTGVNDSVITIKALDGDDASQQFKKYAKGKLRATSRVRYTHSYTSQECTPDSIGNLPAPTTHTYTYLSTYTAEIEIHKSFSFLDNNIVGPMCVGLDEKVTYSVEPWVSLYMLGTVGFDSYDWNIPSGIGSAIYYSADSSSVTFTAARKAIEGEAIGVRMGSCNIKSGASPISIPIREAIPDFNIVPNVCIPGGEKTVYFKVDSAIEGVTYSFSVDENWKIYNKAGQLMPTYGKVALLKGDSVKVETDINNRSTVYVTASYIDGNGCESKQNNVRLMRSLSSMSSISPQASIKNDCYTAGQAVTFTLNNAPSPALFDWDLPEGWTGSSTAATITATPSNGALISPIDSIRVSVDVCNAAYISRNVYVTPGAVDSITEKDHKSLCIQKDSTYTFQISPTSPKAASYTWVLSSGWADTVRAADGLSITAKATDDNISMVKVTPNGAKHVGSTQAACTGASRQLTLSYPPAKPAGISISKSCVNAGLTDELTFSVTQPSTSENYEWTFTYSYNATTTTKTGASVKLSTDGSLGTIYASVVATPKVAGGSCSESDARDTTIEVSDRDFAISYFGLPNMPYQFYPVNNPYPNEVGISYKAWLYKNSSLVPNGAVVNNPPANMVTINDNNVAIGDITGSQTYALVLDVLYAGGCRVRKTLGAEGALPPNHKATLRSMPVSGVSAQTAATMSTKKVAFATVYPNPTTDVINIDIANGASYPLDILVVDMKGTLVTKTTATSASTQINSSSWAVGSYFVVVGSGKKVHHQQMVVKN